MLMNLYSLIEVTLRMNGMRGDADHCLRSSTDWRILVPVRTIMKINCNTNVRSLNLPSRMLRWFVFEVTIAKRVEEIDAVVRAVLLRVMMLWSLMIRSMEFRVMVLVDMGSKAVASAGSMVVTTYIDADIQTVMLGTGLTILRPLTTVTIMSCCRAFVSEI